MEAGRWRCLLPWSVPREDRRGPEGKPGLKVRVSVVLPRGEDILLIRHRRDARHYWVLPGGGLNPGEGLAACGAREVREETGLDIEVQRLVYVAEVLSPSREKHVLDLIFLGRMIRPDQPLRASRHWTIEEPHFLAWRDLLSLEFYPPIGFEIMEDWQTDWDGPIRFLGNQWMDAEPEETPQMRYGPRQPSAHARPSADRVPGTAEVPEEARRIAVEHS